MSSSAITTQVVQLKAGNIQNQADSSSIYSSGQWSFKNSTAVASVTISDAGNVGIGTASPNKQGVSAALTVNSSSGYSTYELTKNNSLTWSLATDGVNGAYETVYGAQPRIFSVNGAERMRIDSSGQFLVGTTAPVFGGNTVGKTFIVSAGVPMQLRCTLATAGKGWNVGPASGNEFVVYNQNSTGMYIADGATSWTANSDERMKKNIKPLELGLEQIKALKPARFDYNQDESEESARVGFIAQEVLPVLPHAVSVPEDSEQMMGVSPTEMIPVLVKAIQELEARLAALESK